MGFILAIILLLTFTTIAMAAASFAPWVPAKGRDLERIFKLADLKAGETFYDLGCGDGRVISYAAKNYKDAKIIGLEISLPFYLICKLRQIFNKNITLKYKNLFAEDLSEADVIYFFGTPKTINDKLESKLEKEAKPGAKIISYVFPINNWQPARLDRPSKSDLPIYLYIK